MSVLIKDTRDPEREVFAAFERRTDRQLVGLRGHTRNHLDSFLLWGPFKQTGIGRTAFVLAAMDLVSELAECDPERMEAFEKTAREHEDLLSEAVPWGKGL